MSTVLAQHEHLVQAGLKLSTMEMKLMHTDELPFVAGADLETSGEEIEVLSPTSGTCLSAVKSADQNVIDRAFESAAQGQIEWAKRSVRERSKVLHSISREILRRGEELAELLVSEVGKPIREAKGEVNAAASYFQYYAELAVHTRGESIEIDRNDEIWLRREPRGTVLAILPWNYPAALVARKAAPALAAGNAVIIKPHENTPLSAFWLARLMLEAGLPDELISVLPGSGDVGHRLASDTRVDLVTMTGSIRAGRSISAAAAPNLIPVSLELGGKAPFIVTESADIKIAAAAAIESRFSNNGQVCICAERIYVQRSIEKEFVRAFIDGVKSLVVGDPNAASTDLGPKISEVELQKVEGLVRSAVADGAEVLYQAELPDDLPSGGYWQAPVVLGRVTDSMDLMKQEIFGPVAPITVFDSESEVVERANDSDYGLSAYVFSNDQSQVMRLLRNLECGEVYINRAGPEDHAGYHTGIKHSGLGGDDGPHGFETYWRKKSIYMRWEEHSN